MEEDEPTPSKNYRMKLVLRIMKAELSKNFETMGNRMDPFALVHWTDSDGEPFELCKTRVDWNAHMSPVWEHTCRPQSFTGKEMVKIEVLEANMVANATRCGEVSCPVADLVNRMEGGVPSTSQAAMHPETCLTLSLNGQETGKVFIEAMLVPLRGCARPSLTVIDPQLFENPVQRLGVSGGTAPFFKLVLLGGEKPSDFYIGKDLSRASDEMHFYEEAKLCRESPSAATIMPLLDFTFDYAGVVSLHEEKANSKKPMELLVLENLHSGRSKLRLLDIKVGQKTAQAGWQGKSRAAALKQSIVDGHTNSAGEGFRLEGFDGQPSTLKSMDPLLDVGQKNAKLSKKAMRIMLQRMTAASMLMYYLDLHDVPLPSQAALAHQLGRAEMAEIVLHETMVRVTRLAMACLKCTVPQKWIGSSVALGFDMTGCQRGEEEKLRRKTIVSIFDWGRSELNTIEKHSSLTANEQHDRSKYWRFYSGGVLRLSWEVARAYYQHFCNVGRWERVAFMVYDFDSMSDNDFMGKIDLTLEPTRETTVPLNLNKRLFRLASSVAKTEWKFWQRVAKMTYSIEWLEHPATSRLQGVWRVKLIRASNLPREDLYLFSGSSDPLVEVVAYSSNFCFRQRSSTKTRNLNPVWNEVFELPVARSAAALGDAMVQLGIELPEDAGSLFPPEKPPAQMLLEKKGGGEPMLLKQAVQAEESERKETGELTRRWEELLAKAADVDKESVPDPAPKKACDLEVVEDALSPAGLPTIEIQEGQKVAGGCPTCAGETSCACM